MTDVLVSADSHVTEPIELYEERVDARFRDRVPRIVERDGWRTLVSEGVAPRKLMTVSELDLAVVGGADPEQRRREQAQDGVAAEVVYPNWALTVTFVGDPALQFAVAGAYNDWAHDHLMTEHRSLPVAMIPMADVDAAVVEARRCADLGFRALSLPARVDEAEYNDPVYDPFWACATELGLPLTFHSGTGHDPRMVRGPGANVLNYVLAAQMDGPRVLLFLAAGGVLDRFPDLRVVVVETGASWLGWVMTQADEVAVDHARFSKLTLSDRPSAFIRRQCSATFMVDPVAVRNRDVTGTDVLMWGNDYPHPEGTWPNSAPAVAEQFAGVAEPDRAAILGGNAARLFGFDPSRLVVSA
ncbi:MAG: amidohydrolase family protein [Actinomycetes bacterium]